MAGDGLGASLGRRPLALPDALLRVQGSVLTGCQWWPLKCPPIGVRRGGMARGRFYIWVHMAVLFAHGGRCVYCGAESRVMDHVIPLAAGGEDTSKNLVPACDDCNLSKSDNSLPQWIMRREFQRPAARIRKPLGEATLLDQYQDAHQECVRTIRRVQSVCAEIADPARRRWFQRRFPAQRAPRDRDEVYSLRHRAVDQVNEAHLSDFSTPPRPIEPDPSEWSDVLDAFFGTK